MEFTRVVAIFSTSAPPSRHTATGRLCTKGGRDACEHAQVCVCERVRVALIHGPARSHAARSHSHHHHRLAHAGFCCNDAGRPAFFFCVGVRRNCTALFFLLLLLFLWSLTSWCVKNAAAPHTYTHTQCSANSSCVCVGERESEHQYSALH